MVEAGEGLPAEWTGTLAYAPPTEWTHEERKALANSILVEYVNTYDAWYTPPGHGGHGGILSDIDSMVQLTNLNFSGPGSWNDGACAHVWCVCVCMCVYVCVCVCGGGGGSTNGNAGNTVTLLYQHIVLHTNASLAADMLQLCTYGGGGTIHSKDGMTLSEYRAEYSVWAVLASPLILSADIRNLQRDHPDCLAVMTNPEIVAVNQDPAGFPPRLVYQTTNTSTSVSVGSSLKVMACDDPLASGVRAANCSLLTPCSCLRVCRLLTAHLLLLCTCLPLLDYHSCL
jgi:hypothetical protein